MGFPGRGLLASLESVFSIPAICEGNFMEF